MMQSEHDKTLRHRQSLFDKEREKLQREEQRTARKLEAVLASKFAAALLQSFLASPGEAEAALLRFYVQALAYATYASSGSATTDGIATRFAAITSSFLAPSSETRIAPLIAVPNAILKSTPTPSSFDELARLAGALLINAYLPPFFKTQAYCDLVHGTSGELLVLID